MIASGYSLHLYCSCATCRANGGMRKFNGGFAEFGGVSKSDALRDARKAGWRIRYKTGLCWAPRHKRSATDTAEL